jgi:hypothetical protein
VVELALRAEGRRRRVVPVPLGVLRALLRAGETLTGPAAFVTWDEALASAVPMLTARGTADLEVLGVHPRRMAEVLGL